MGEADAENNARLLIFEDEQIYSGTMTSEILQIPTIENYNEWLGAPTVNNLVSVLDFSKLKKLPDGLHTFGFYAIYLKDGEFCDIVYGRRKYDYQKGTIVAIAPNQVSGVTNYVFPEHIKAYALCFDPELIRGTELGRRMKEYDFFSYEASEALHVSQQERSLFLDCLDKIRQEIERPADIFSKRIIVANITLLLDYCLRFYQRQFTTRESSNQDLLSRFETLMDKYYSGGRAREMGLPTVRYCAGEMCLSPNYFGDLVKKETGMTAQEYIQKHTIDVAKNLLSGGRLTISEVAYELGFQYPQHFCRMFKKVTGLTPGAYRKGCF